MAAGSDAGRQAEQVARIRSARRLLPPAGSGLPALDRLAGLAARLLHSPSAQVSLLTDVQLIAGGSGLPPDAVGTVSRLCDSLCEVTAEGGAPLVIEDATVDHRVCLLPPVTSGQVRCYLGAPLIADADEIVGVLCVFGPQPRTWTGPDVEIMQQLAASVVAELELSALSRDYESTRARWEVAIDAAGVGSFDWDLEAGVLDWDQRLIEMFGYEPADFDYSIDAFYRRLHPDDVARISADLDTAIATGGRVELEYRVVLPSGDTRWVQATGRALTDHSGRTVRLLGAALDATELREGEARVGRVLESMSTAFLSMDRRWRIAYVNAEAERLLDRPRGALVGHELWQALPELGNSPFEQALRDAARTSTSRTVETPYPRPLNAWYEVRVLPTPDGLSLYFLDVTARRASQELLELTAAVGEQLASSRDAAESVRRLAESVVPRLADRSIVSLSGAEDVVGGGGPPQQPESGSRAVVSLVANGRALGTLTLIRHGDRPVLTEEELGVARIIAERAGLAMENARLYAQQRDTAQRLREANVRLTEAASHHRDVARALQEAMLTTLPRAPGLELVARYHTATGDEQVGGDWYDAVALPNGATGLMIGDVVGHDIGAAARMGQLRNMLRAFAWDRGERPWRVVARLDRAIRGLQLGTLATLLLATVEPADGHDGRRLRWTTAGHPPPAVLLPDGTAQLLEGAPDLLLGVDPDVRRRDHVVELPEGSTLLLYTDGLVETRDTDLDERLALLLTLLAECGRLPLDQLLDTILEQMVHGHRGDDIALLGVRLVSR